MKIVLFFIGALLLIVSYQQCSPLNPNNDTSSGGLVSSLEMTNSCQTESNDFEIIIAPSKISINSPVYFSIKMLQPNTDFSKVRWQIGEETLDTNFLTLSSSDLKHQYTTAGVYLIQAHFYKSDGSNFCLSKKIEVANNNAIANTIVPVPKSPTPSLANPQTPSPQQNITNTPTPTKNSVPQDPTNTPIQEVSPSPPPISISPAQIITSTKTPTPSPTITPSTTPTPTPTSPPTPSNKYVSTSCNPDNYSYATFEAKIENGLLYTKASYEGDIGSADSGWVQGTTASAGNPISGDGARVTADFTGIISGSARLSEGYNCAVGAIKFP